MHLLLPVGQTHCERNAAISEGQVQIVSAVSRVEKQTVWLAGAEIKGYGILGANYRLGARLTQVVREELCTAERCFRWRLLLLTILAIILEVSTLANWTGISGYADAAVLARIVALAGIRGVAANALKLYLQSLRIGITYKDFIIIYTYS